MRKRESINRAQHINLRHVDVWNPVSISALQTRTAIGRAMVLVNVFCYPPWNLPYTIKPHVGPQEDTTLPR